MHRGEGERVLGDLQQLLLIVGKAAACAAERERRAQHHGIADVERCLAALVERVRRFGREHRLAQRLAQLLEFFAVLRARDALAPRAEYLNLALVQHALFLELHHEIQPRLPADAGHDCVRAFVADDARHVFGRERLHVHLVGNGGVGHDGRGVGVCQHDLIALLAQGKARLRARVVELGGLPDDDRAGADDQNLVNVGSLRHGRHPPAWR